MAGLLPWFSCTPEQIYAIKEELDNRLIADAIRDKVVTADTWIIRDIMPKTDFGAAYYDNEEWESAVSLTQYDYTKTIDVSLSSYKMIGFYGVLGPSTQGVSVVKHQLGDNVIDKWQTETLRQGVLSTSGFEKGFLGVTRPGEQIVYSKKTTIRSYYYGTQTAAADDTTVLLGRVIEPVGRTAMGAGALAKTRAGLLPWFMVTPGMVRATVDALDRELVKRALEQGVVTGNDYEIEDILPSTEFGSTYYAHNSWVGAVALTKNDWKEIIRTDLDSKKLMGFYGYLGPDDMVTALRFKVGTAQTKDVWMLEQCRRGELTSPGFQESNRSLTRTPIIYNGDDTLVVDAYGADNISGSQYFTGILLGRVIKPKVGL
jgi:hypothetical protein